MINIHADSVSHSIWVLHNHLAQSLITDFMLYWLRNLEVASRVVQVACFHQYCVSLCIYLVIASLLNPTLQCLQR